MFFWVECDLVPAFTDPTYVLKGLFPSILDITFLDDIDTVYPFPDLNLG